MKRIQRFRPTRLIAFTLFAFFLLVCNTLAENPQNATTQDSPGKKIFVEKKCNICHAIKTAGVAKKGASPSTSTDTKKGPPDLSNVGTERTADWIMKYLTKKVDLNGKKHGKGWTGKEEDLSTLAKWLETLKTVEKTQNK